MAACQEVRHEDLLLSRSCVAPCAGSIAAPAEPAPAVADLAVVPAEPKDIVQPDDETFAAMRWASKLDDASSVLSLIRSLPTAVVDEQVHSYRRRSETAVAEAAQRQGPLLKISCGPNSRLVTKQLVAHHFHKFCRADDIPTDQKLPYGAMRAFINDNINWTSKKRRIESRTIRKWYAQWRSSSTALVAAVVADDGALVTISSQRSFLRSRAVIVNHKRRRGHGGGRPFKADLVRIALYE